jgi:hypothetical protein
MHRYRARRILRADHRGSSWPVLAKTEAGVFYTKLRSAAQAPASLRAELIVGALADALGLNVPARVLIEIPPGLDSEDRRDELLDLVRASAGLNLGFQLLPEPQDFRADDLARVEPALASTIVWLDGLVLNPDRTIHNPNLLWSHERLWLIDHGACLGFQHDWARVTEQAPRAPWTHFEQHVLRSRATRLAELDQSLATRIDRATLEAAVALVPDEFFTPRHRGAFEAFLWKRLKAPRPFLSSSGEASFAVGEGHPPC